MDPSPAQPRSVFDGLSLQRYVAFLVQNTHLICTDRNSRTCPRDHDRNAELFDHTCRFVGKKGSDSITSLADSSSERSFWRWDFRRDSDRRHGRTSPGRKQGVRCTADGGHEGVLCLPDEMLPRSKDSGLESSWGDAEPSAGFLDGHLVVIRHRKCLSEHGAHFAEQFVDCAKGFRFRADHFRVGLCRGNSFDPRSLVGFAGVWEGLNSFRFPFSPDHEGGVEHDAGEPGGERGPALEASQMTIGRKHRVLDGVFSVFLISENGVGQSDEFRTRSSEHFMNCFPLVAGRCGPSIAHAAVPSYGNAQGVRACLQAGGRGAIRGFGQVVHEQSLFRSFCTEAFAGPTKNSVQTIRHRSCFQGKRAEPLRSEMKMLCPVRNSWRGFDGNVGVVTLKNLLERHPPPQTFYSASLSMIWRHRHNFSKWHARCTTERGICIGERSCG